MGKRDPLETAMALIGLWGVFLFGILMISNIPDSLKIIGIFADTSACVVAGWVLLGKSIMRKKDEITFWTFIIVSSIDVFTSWYFAIIISAYTPVFYVNGVPLVPFYSLLFSLVYYAIGLIYLILIIRRLIERKRRK
jgi:glucan phosphoethanolaminetransferase (alkaline phosphatase superfamily)